MISKPVGLVEKLGQPQVAPMPNLEAESITEEHGTGFGEPGRLTSATKRSPEFANLVEVTPNWQRAPLKPAAQALQLEPVQKPLVGFALHAQEPVLEQIPLPLQVVAAIHC